MDRNTLLNEKRFDLIGQLFLFTAGIVMLCSSGHETAGKAVSLVVIALGIWQLASAVRFLFLRRSSGQWKSALRPFYHVVLIVILPVALFVMLSNDPESLWYGLALPGNPICSVYYLIVTLLEYFNRDSMSDEEHLKAH